MAAFTDFDMQSQYLTPESEKQVRTESASAFKKNAPSPDGAASQGALGAPAEAGETSQDMLGMFNNASPEDRDHLTNQVTESLAPHGKSPQGALEEILMPGGQPNLHAIARAADFGIDLKGLAQKTSGAEAQKAQKNVGVAFGQVPEEGQAGPVKSEGKALADMTSKEKGVARDQAEQAETDKKNRRDAIAAFLMETGLRLLASDKSDAGAAFGEAALGTVESGRSRQRQDAADEMNKSEEARRVKRSEQQTEAHTEAMKGDLVKITDKDTGDTMFVREKDGFITTKDGKRVREATDSELSAAQRETNRRAVAGAMASETNRIRKAVDDGFSDDPDIQSIIDETTSKKRNSMTERLAKERVAAYGYDLSILEAASGDDSTTINWSEFGS